MSASDIVRELFDRADIGMSLVALPSRQFLRVNEKLCEITRYSAAELTSMTTVALTHPDDRVADRETFARFLRGEIPRRVVEKRYIRKDGTIVWVRITTTVVQSGNESCAFGITEDITARREAQHELEVTERRKHRFLSLLAHELRNPLASIRNSAAILREGTAGAEAESQAIDVIERQSANLGLLVSDLLDASRITTGKVSLRRAPERLSELVDEALDVARPLITGRRHALHLERPAADEIWVDADRLRIVQAISNLLQNAARYTPEGGTIRVEVTRAADAATVAVIDNGVGIDAHELPYVFELFQRGRDPGSGEGLGIGLTITRQLVEMHGGQIAVSSRPACGSTFTITLRTVPPPSMKTAPTSEPATPVVPRDVLIVEDNVDVAETLCMLLQLHGHRVRVAHNGAACLAALDKGEPEAVIMDLGLPDIHGHDLARRLRERPEARSCLMIALSGFGEESDIRKSMDAGFDHHLVKPVDHNVIEELLARGT